MAREDLERALTAAAEHEGVVTSEQLRAAGCHPRWGDRHVRRGLWQRPARGVYVPHDRPLSGVELARAARALAGTDVVVSGLVVLRELGLRWLPDTTGVLALVDPSVRTPSSGQVVLRRSQGLAQLDTWTVGGIPRACPPRAVVDAGRELSRLRDVRGVVLGAVADGWAGTTDLRAHLGATQRNGSGLTRRAILDAERGCASPPEAEVVDELLGCGVPFYVNPELRLDGRRLCSPDIWFLGTGLGGEVESQERHGSDDDTESTYDRHERVTDHGIALVHLSVRRIRQDPAVAAAYLVGRAMARRAEGPAEPTGLVIVPRGPLLR